MPLLPVHCGCRNPRAVLVGIPTISISGVPVGLAGFGLGQGASSETINQNHPGKLRNILIFYGTPPYVCTHSTAVRVYGCYCGRGIQSGHCAVQLDRIGHASVERRAQCHVHGRWLWAQFCMLALAPRAVIPSNYLEWTSRQLLKPAAAAAAAAAAARLAPRSYL